MGEEFLEELKEDLTTTLRKTTSARPYSVYKNPTAYARAVEAIKRSTPATVERRWKQGKLDIMQTMLAVHHDKLSAECLLSEEFSRSPHWVIALALEERRLPLEHFLQRRYDTDSSIAKALKGVVSQRILLLKDMYAGGRLGLKMAARYFGHVKANPRLLHPLMALHIAALQKISDGAER